MKKEQDGNRLTISPITMGTRIVAGVSLAFMGGACALLGVFLSTYGQVTPGEIVRSIFLFWVPGIAFLIFGLFVIFRRYDIITFDRSTGELTIRKWKLKTETRFTYSLSDIKAVNFYSSYTGGEYGTTQFRLELSLGENRVANRPEKEKLTIGVGSKAMAEKVAAFLNVPFYLHEERSG